MHASFLSVKMARTGAMGSRHLRLSKYSAAYRDRLATSGGQLDKYLLKEEGISLNHLLKEKPQIIDACLEKYVSSCHNSSRKSSMLQTAKHAVLFLQVLRPELRRNLQRSWETLKSWEECLPSALRTPLPVSLLVAMICRSRIEAYDSQDQREKWLAFSTLIGVGFFGLLRPGELLNLKRKHVDLPNSMTFAQPNVTLAIEKPKNHRQLGTTQFSTVKQPDVCNWTSWLCVGKDAESKLWPHSHSEFRRMFKIMCCKLKIDGAKYSPASLRAGGATFYFDQLHDVNRLRLMGRWSNAQSLEHYVQVGKGQQLLHRMSPEATKIARTLLAEGNFLLHLPAAKASALAKSVLIPAQLWSSYVEPSHATRQWASLGQET